MERVIEALFTRFVFIRYVAVYHQHQLFSRQRTQLPDASASESDRYEELLVNPALLTLTSQRGNIDCGGLKYLLVRYGNFFQLVLPLPKGHLSICLDPSVKASEEAEHLLAFLKTDHPSLLQE